MIIVSVAATGNGSGKTLLLERILRAFPGRLHAVKFTTVFRDGVNCPRTETDCACRSLHGRYTIVDDPEVLGRESTDTGRLARAGALSVRWCLARPGAHAAAWGRLREALTGGRGDVITEGNSVVPILDPDLLVTVMSPAVPRERWKPDAWDLARRADLVVINPYGAAEIDAHALADEVAGARPAAPPIVQDLSVPLASWPDPMLARLVAGLLGVASGAGADPTGARGGARR